MRGYPQSPPAQETNGRGDGDGINEDAEEDSRAHRGDSAGVDSRTGTDQDAAPARQARGGISRIVVSPNGMSSYHGQTSTHFEESLPERAPAADARPRMPDDWVEKGLVAEAAKQRTSLEPVSRRSSS
ncbi:hypothetical protein IMZ48_14715 [Candidatus Bathyarchaeota archaeon]|nr:hypothetical protein [Candidatus Bathyarchaeota archaeon]